MSNNKDESQHQAKDTALIIGWIVVIVMLASILWIFTKPLRDNLLITAVNKVLEQSGDSRRLEELYSQDLYFKELHSRDMANNFGMSKWFAFKTFPDNGDAKRAFVFSFVGEGTFFPCIAVVNRDDRVEEFIPLNSHGKKVINRISPGVLKIYSSRIGGNK